MARGSGTKNDLVKCKYCGEMYSTTYKHCPFCNEDGTGSWDDPDTEETGKGGKRLAGGGSSWKRPSIGTIVGGILSLALIIAAICIVVSIVRPLLGGGKKPTPTPTAAPSQSAVASEKPVESQPAESAAPVETAPVETEEPPEPTVPVVDETKPTSFTISRDDMSFFNPGEYWDLKVKLEPADATAEVTWTSSDPNVASVSWNGRVVAVSKGTVTITAAIEGVGEQKCIVRCQFKDQDTVATPAPGNTTTSDPNGNGAGLTINRDDFTLSRKGETWRLVVSGTTSPVTWTTSNDGVATVDSSGLVTGVSRGTCTVTAEVDGVTLKCIVRCSFSD